jgi:sulfur-oxidizing protein SoxX
MRVWILMAITAALAGSGRAAEPVVAYTITNGSEITESLTGAPGDAARGRAIYAGEARAGCPACHGVPGLAVSALDFAEPNLEGPNLAGVGGRLSAGAIRLWIVAPSAIAQEATMPAYYAAGQRDGAEDPLYGGPAMTAAEIEDLVAYLVSLRTPG